MVIFVAKFQFNALSTDAHCTLGSPSGRAGAKRLRGLTAPIPPTNYLQNHRTDSLYETAFLHKLSAHPSPPPFGRYLSRRERQGLCANFKQPHKPQFIALSIDTHRTLGSPDRRAGAKRLRGLTALIPPTNYLQNHRTDSTDRLPSDPLHRFYLQSIHRTTAPIPYTKLHSCTNCLHDSLLLGEERQELCANFKLLDQWEKTERKE